jgi:CHAT domain-containing protein
MAGARTVISALWPVDDKTTASLMDQIFSGSEGSIPEAMRQAALKQIADARSHGKFAHPFFWAAFIATGDWKQR